MLLTSSLEQATPRGDVRATAEKSTTLALRHSAPDPPLDVVVERLRKALGAYGALPAHLLGAILCRATNEEFIGASALAGRHVRPLLVPRHVFQPLPRENELCLEPGRLVKAVVLKSSERYGA